MTRAERSMAEIQRSTAALLVLVRQAIRAASQPPQQVK